MESGKINQPLEIADKEAQTLAISQTRESLAKVNSGDTSEVPPYMTTDEWKTQLALQLDEIDHPELVWCDACNKYHTVEHNG